MNARWLVELLRPERLTHVVDVGANPIEGDPPYKAMLGQGLLRVTGFEPQPEALAELNRRKGPRETYLPHALGDGGAGTLNVCRYSGWTSLLRPDPRALDAFPHFRANATVIGQVPLQTHRLDDLDDVEAFDMLKIDVQGGEMNVFGGGAAKLAQAVAVQTEVSFIPLYENQAGFGVVDLALRKLGFVPHCFAQIKRWPVGSLKKGGDPTVPWNQLLEGDLVYVRDFVHPEAMTDEQLKHLCLLMHHVYGSTDLSGWCIEALQQRGRLPGDALRRYVDGVNKQG